MAVPSELMTGGPEKSPVKSKLICAGGGRNERKVREGSCSRRRDQSRPASSRSASEAHAICSRHFFRGANTGVGVIPEPLVLIQRNSRAISAALCQRDSGSFARQPCTT